MASLIRQTALSIVLVFSASFSLAAPINYPPTVADTPDVVIGDAEGVSAANIFVYPNAINLDAIGCDDMTSASALKWSYSSPDGVYRINGAEPVEPAVDDLVNPPANKRLDTQTDPLDPDHARTITFRDNLRSPLNEAGGEGPYPDRFGTGPGAPKIVDSKVVTLYCSDGTTVSLQNGRSIVVYTLDNGFDRLSGCVHDWPPDPRPPYGWSFANYTSGGAEASITANGICISVPQSGDNDGAWASPFGVVPLEPNTVWEVRLLVTTTQTQYQNVPLWTLVYDNTGGAGSGKGHDEFGGEFFFLGNEGGANCPVGTYPNARYEYSCFIMPVAMQTPQFESSQEGYFNPRVDADNDIRISLRVLDVGASYGAQFDSGMICWGGLAISKHSLSDMVVDGTTSAVSQFTDPRESPDLPSSWQLEVSGQGAVPVYKNGAVSILPVDDWTSNTVIMFRPGDLDTSIIPARFADNWPIPWVSEKLYYIEFMLSSPSAFDEINPPDMIRVGADTLTSELCCVNFAVPNTPDLSHGPLTPLIYRGLSMPRTGTPQKYGCFFYSHSASRTDIVGGACWRPRLEILTSQTLQPMGRPTNPGGITVNSMTVQRVHFSK